MQTPARVEPESGSGESQPGSSGSASWSQSERRSSGRGPRVLGIRANLLGRPATVDREDDAGDEARGVAREVERRPSDVLRLSEIAGQRLEVLQAGAKVRVILNPAALGRADDGRADDVRADAALRVGDRHGARQGDDTALAGRVGVRRPVLVAAYEPEHGGDVDYRAAACLEELRHGVLADEEDGLQVDVEHVLPGLERARVQRAIAETPSAHAETVEDDVEPAVALDAGSDRQLPPPPGGEGARRPPPAAPGRPGDGGDLLGQRSGHRASSRAKRRDKLVP